MVSRVVVGICLVGLCAICQACLFCLGGNVPAELFNTKWTYNDSSAARKAGLLTPDEWKKSFAFCDSSLQNAQQSPINIEHDKVKVETAGVLPLNINFNGTACRTHIRNIGSTISVTPFGTCNASFTTASGTNYKFYEAHLHWHQLWNHRGTEHKVDGQSEAVEAHIVHYNSKFASIDDAFEDGSMGNIAIIAIRYTVAETPGEPTEALALDTFIAKPYPTLRYMDPNLTIEGDALYPYNLIGKSLNLTNLPMYHYNGSLTTPRCDSVVSWFIVQQTVRLSQSQIYQLRMFSHVNVSENTKPKLGFNNDANIRPVAPLNGRTVVAWPVVIQPNMTSDSAVDYSGLKTWQLALIIGGSVLVAAIIVIIIVVVVVKNRRKAYNPINTSA